MMMMRVVARYDNMIRLIAVLLLFFAFISIIFADGKELYIVKGCVSCHGESGGKALLPNYPTLKGQNSDYLLQQIRDIKSGVRANGQSAVMKPFTLILNEDEMKQISDYLARQK